MTKRLQPKLAGRTAFVLLILASFLAFRYGWFSRAARGITPVNFEDPSASGKAGAESWGKMLMTDWGTPFAKEYQKAKAKAIAKHVAVAPRYSGEYVEYLVEDLGHTHSDTILVTPSNEYFSEIKTCVTNGPKNFGTVRDLGEGRLELCPKTRDQPGSDRCIIMCAIPWGERQYLVGETKLSQFVGAIAAGKEPRNDGVGDFLMREDDWNKPADGKPRIPKTK